MLVGRVGRRGAWLKGAGSLDDLESTHPATQQVLFARHCAIKKMLEPLDRYNAEKWKKISKTKTRKIMLLPEYTINGYDEKTTNRVHHFIIQQVRIPINEKPTIKKIIQVALNIGQYKGTNDGNFIYNIKFNDISQFIYKTDIIELSKHISDEMMEKINEYLSSV